MNPQYLVILSVIGWGVGSLFYKQANDNIHPLMVSTIVTLTYAVLTPFAFLFVKFPHTVNATGVGFAVGGGLCMCLGSLGYFYALRSGSAGNITILTSLYPALTLLLSCIFLKEAIGLKQGIGMGLALVSFVLLSMK